MGAIIYRGVTCSRVSYNSHTAEFRLDFSAFTFDDFCAMLNSDYLYDAAVSVKSLHHFTLGQKIPLYKKLHDSLKEVGYFILTDYMAENDEKEKESFLELALLKKELGISDGEFYHYDTPLTRAHETEALLLEDFQKLNL